MYVLVSLKENFGIFENHCIMEFVHKDRLTQRGYKMQLIHSNISYCFFIMI